MVSRRVCRVNKAIDHLSTYLPVLVMALLALFTYWLAHQPEEQTKSIHTHSGTNVPDFVLKNFSLSGFDDQGHLQAHLRAEQAWHFQEMDQLRLQGLHLKKLNGLMGTVDAGQARANGEFSQIEFWSGVDFYQTGKTAATPNQMWRVHGEYFRWVQDEQLLYSILPVKMVRDGLTLHAGSMLYDGKSEKLTLNSGVKTYWDNLKPMLESQPK